MFVPEKMEQIYMVFLDRDVDRVTDALVRHGTIHMVDAGSMDGWAETLGKAGNGDEPEELRKRRERVEGLIRDLGLSMDLIGLKPMDMTMVALDGWMEKHEPAVHAILTQVSDKQNELVHLNEIKSRMDGFSQLTFAIHDRDSYTYLVVEAGRMITENLDILENRMAGILHVVSPIETIDKKTSVVVVALRRDMETFKHALVDSGFESLDLGEGKEDLSPEFFKTIQKRIQSTREEIEEIKRTQARMAQDLSPWLSSGLFHIRKDVLKQKILKYFRKTDRTYLLSGWLPAIQLDSFTHEVFKATHNRCIVRNTSAENLSSVREGILQVPVQMKNPAFFRPFEMLTLTYGTPSYRTLDPTPILGISFLLMFGLMFGDVGHGLVLALLGGFLVLNKRKPGLRNAGLLLLYAGSSSIIFGFLFGSIFGLEELLPTLWLKPMESISRLFMAVIYFGIGMISISIVINLVNGIRRRDFLVMIFDKAGLIAAILYWCGILLVTRYMSSKTESSGQMAAIVPILMAASIFLLFFREPIIHLLQGKKKLFPEGVIAGVMGGLVEILDIVLGFLANTVSFIRVAAFGLAHAGLFMAIFALSDLVKTSAHGIASALVLLFGNILIICLEGLVVSIQGVRLEFYEFFTRFFERGEATYRPLKSELTV